MKALCNRLQVFNPIVEPSNPAVFFCLLCHLSGVANDRFRSRLLCLHARRQKQENVIYAHCRGGAVWSRFLRLHERKRDSYSSSMHQLEASDGRKS
jgi:hypothetical protein